MSIIHNALKKLQEEKHKKEHKTASQAHTHSDFMRMSALVQEEQQKAIHTQCAQPVHPIVPKMHYGTHHHFSLVIYFILFLAITALIVIGNYYFFQWSYTFVHDLNMRRTMVVKKNVPSVQPRKAESKPIEKAVSPRHPLTTGKKDSFDFLSLSNVFAQKFVCTGVIYDAKSPVAIINESIVELGDTIDGARVVAIYPEEVVIRYRKKKFSLPIK